MDSAGNMITYREMDVSKKLFNSLLHKFKIGGGCRVAILLEKSFASAIAINTTPDISAAYIPIDVNLPRARIEQIILDSKPHVILHDRPDLFKGKESHPCSIWGMEGTYITVLLVPNYDEADATGEVPNMFRENIFSVLYTSGSTGIPKGVCIPIEAGVAFSKWCTATFDIREGDQIASIAPFHFDLSIADIFASRLKRATLHLFKSDEVKNVRLMSALLATKKINTIYATPTFFSALLEFGKLENRDWSHLRTVLFAGEVFPVRQLHALMSVWSNAKFYNLYGPTETNVCTFTEIHCEENKTEPYPIGKPCLGHEFEITSEGELIIGGPHVANGYLNRPELTSEKFFTRNNKRWFRTGDRVEIDQYGDLIYKGRLDRMVKRRGYRIEPGEIEVALSNISGITGAVVVEHNVNDLVLLIAVVTSDASRMFDIVEIKSLLISVIPDYMLPDSIVTVKEFPKTSSGKIDYQKLRQEVVSSLQK